MEVLSSVALIALAVLAVAGLAKLWRPEPTADALVSLGLARSPGVARLLGLLEVVLAAGAAATGHAALLGGAAALYLGFAAVTWQLRRRELRATTTGTAAPSAGCGCFGSSGAPLGRLHLGVNIVLAAVLGLSATEPHTIADQIGDSPASGAVLLALVGLGAVLVITAITTMSELFDSFEPKTRPTPSLRIEPGALRAR